MAAFSALARTLENAGADWNDLGDWIAHPATLSEDEMQEIFDAGRKQGVQEGQRAQTARTMNGHALGQPPSEAAMAEHCHRRIDRLDERHHEFIRHMMVNTRRGWALTAKQQKYLTGLYFESGGKL